MCDKELLEFAAKAAGLDKQIAWGFDSDEIPYWLNDPKRPAPRYWNPLKDDGDAFRLAMALHLSIETDALIEVGYTEGIGGEYEYGCEVWIVYRDASVIKTQELYSGDICAATRLAIVRAAAEIGKNAK